MNRVSKCRFLDVWLDEQVSWSDRINYILSKIAKNNGILSKIRFFIDKTIALMLYLHLFIHICHIIILFGLQITLQN